MSYKCPHAVIRGAMDPIRCTVSGTVCAHQKMCLMEGRIVLTGGANDCPGRDGRSLDSARDDTEESPDRPDE